MKVKPNYSIELIHLGDQLRPRVLACCYHGHCIKYLPDDWGDIEGPASPPKQATGSMNDAMTAENKKKDVTEPDSVHQSPEQSTETDNRVPENGTSVVDAVTSSVEEKHSSQKPEVLSSTADFQSTDSNKFALISKGEKENMHSETNIQENTALGNEDVASKEALLDQDTDTAQVAQSEGSVQETQKSDKGDASVSVPSVMVPLSVDTNIKTRDKGDMVVVGSEGTTPSSESTACTNKGNSHCSPKISPTTPIHVNRKDDR